MATLRLTPANSFLLVGDFGLMGGERAAPVRPTPVAAVASETDTRDATRALANAAMERYARGDDQAFSPLYDALAPRLHTFLVRQTRDVSRADDLLQQTMLQIHRARGRFTAGAEVMPWAFAIARRLVIDSHRRKRPEVSINDADGTPDREPVAPLQAADDLLHTKRLTHALDRELQKLPEQHRVAFELIKKEGLSVREAAAVLGTTATAIKLRAHRAYVALRAALGDVIDRN